MMSFRLSCVGFLLLATAAMGKDNTPPNLIAGKQVERDAKIKKGDKLVGVWEKKNYLIEVVDIRRNGKLKVLWGGEPYDDIERSDLYYIGEDAPTRKKKVSPLPQAYRAFDKNGDGQIGLYEWERSKFADFKKLDKNNDGFLTPQELAEKPSTVAVAASDAKPTAESQPKTDKPETKEVTAPPIELPAEVQPPAEAPPQ